MNSEEIIEKDEVRSNGIMSMIVLMDNHDIWSIIYMTTLCVLLIAFTLLIGRISYKLWKRYKGLKSYFGFLEKDKNN